MCRLLGVVSAASNTVNNLLGEHLAPFVALSENNCDGWGIASWSAAGALTVAKAPEPARTSPEFAAEMAGTVTDTAIVHLRKASVGMANNQANTHPFFTSSIALEHNGFSGPIEVLDALVAEAGGRPAAGDTDSARFFELVLALTATLPPAQALGEAARRIAARGTVVSLNALLLTENALYALCWYDEVEVLTEPGGAEGYHLHYTRTPDQVLVASTGWDRAADRWRHLTNGQVLQVTRKTLQVAVHDVTATAPAG